MIFCIVNIDGGVASYRKLPFGKTWLNERKITTTMVGIYQRNIKTLDLKNITFS